MVVAVSKSAYLVLCSFGSPLGQHKAVPSRQSAGVLHHGFQHQSLLHW